MKLNIALATAAITFTSFAADDAGRIADLERRLRDLDQKYHALEEKLDHQDTPPQKAQPTVQIGSSGILFRSADSNFVMQVHGTFQFDSRSYIGDGGVANNDTFVLRRARPVVLEGTLYRDFEFRFLPEFGNGSASAGGNSTATTPSILDASVNYKYSPALQLKLGKFKAPVGLERLQFDAQTTFIERGLPSYLTPDRELGAMLQGELFGRAVVYAAGVFNGVGDNRASSNIDFDDSKEFEGRLFFQPFVQTKIRPLQGMGFGVGGSYGRQFGANGLPNNNGYTSETLQPIFTYNVSTAAGAPNVTADGTHWRIAPQGSYFYGPFSMFAEYVISDQNLHVNLPVARTGTFQNRGWQAAVSYFLTGEKAVANGFAPAHPFDLSENRWGAFELVARYSVLQMDQQLFPNFASAGTSISRAAAWTAGLNWYLNPNIRTSVNFVHTDFQGGDKNPITAKSENAVVTRVQLAY